MSTRGIAFLLSLFISSLSLATPAALTVSPGQTGALIEVELPIASGDLIYSDMIDIKVDNPQVTLSSWQSDYEPQPHFDPEFKETKKGFDHPVRLTMQAAGLTQTSPARLLVSYYRKATGQFVQEMLPIPWPTDNQELDQSVAQSVEAPEASSVQLSTQPSCTPSKSYVQRWFARLSSLMQQSTSLPLRLLIVLLLGLLMSLTPCIYPMIPITAGILQAQASSSVLKNFLLSLSYSLGIATTFAILGLLAAFAGQAMGTILINPYFIIPLVALLAYLAFAMIGAYEMYIPSFLQARTTNVQGGSHLSAFLFGAVSGTVASPCLSPGLVLLLSVVTALQNKMLGFVFLFVFGIGLSIPLLLIGTFSSSLNVLPRAGMWMVEVKRVFGFILLGMCFYFLLNIAPHWLVYACSALTLAAIGIFYLYDASSSRTSRTSFAKNAIGMALIVASIMTGYYAVRSYAERSCEPVDALWNSDYESAHGQALTEHKLLFVDIGAPYCSICTAIDKKFMHDSRVLTTLKSVVPVKLDMARTQDESAIKQFGIKGVPALLVVDPQDNRVITQWAGEVYEWDIDQLIRALTDTSRSSDDSH